MYLPVQYHHEIAIEPNYKGKGEHSVRELEDMCKRFKDCAHQQQIIKQNVMKHFVELKFNIKLDKL